jgi:hypothetical protein
LPEKLISIHTTNYCGAYTNIDWFGLYETPRLRAAGQSDVLISGVMHTAGFPPVSVGTVTWDSEAGDIGSDDKPLHDTDIRLLGEIIPSQVDAFLTYLACAAWESCPTPPPNPATLLNPSSLGQVPDSPWHDSNGAGNPAGNMGWGTELDIHLRMSGFNTITYNFSCFVQSAHGGSGGGDPHIQIETGTIENTHMRYNSYWPATEGWYSVSLSSDISDLTPFLDGCGMGLARIATSGTGWVRDVSIELS